MARRKSRRSGPRLKLLEGDTRTRFLEALRSGVPIRHAANHAGVHDATVFRWLQRGEWAEEALEAGEKISDDDRACMEFYRDHRHARSQVAVRNMALVQRGAQGGYMVSRRTLPDGTVEETFAQPDWRASKFLLETSFPLEFNHARQVEVSGRDGAPLQVDASDTLRALAAGLVERLAEEPSDVMEGEVVEDVPEIEA